MRVPTIVGMSRECTRVRPTSLCDVLRVDADGYLLALFVTGDDLGEPGETVTEYRVARVRGINEVCCQVMGWMPSHLERVLHEGDDDPVHAARKEIAESR